MFLVGTPVFKTGEGRYPVLASSIPVRLRQKLSPALPDVAFGRARPRLRPGQTRRRLCQGAVMDYKLELVIVPVSDVDRAKGFYERAGFRLDVDHRAGEDFRVVQFTPPGSACSMTLMRNEAAAGTVQGLHLMVADLEAARAELLGRGVEVGEPFHFGPQGQTPGLHPERVDYGSFAVFQDPDGTGWLLQERRTATT